MKYAVELIYFRQTGKFLATAETTIDRDDLVEIWEAIDDLRRLGSLPDLRPGAGRDLFILVDVPGHPQRVPHLVMPPFVDDDDVTPPRVSTVEMLPLVRMPLAELPRTSTRDVIKSPAKASDDGAFTDDDDITPVDRPRVASPDEEPTNE